MQGDTTVLAKTNLHNGLRCTCALALALYLAAPLQIHAQQGVLRFHGQVVNATCAVTPAAQQRQPAQVLYLEPQPGLRVAVSRVANACTDSELPLSMRYQPLGGAESTAANQASGGAGVVIVTYQ